MNYGPNGSMDIWDRTKCLARESKTSGVLKAIELDEITNSKLK